MNETVKKAKEHFNKQKRIYIFLGVLLLLGIVAGILYITIISKEDKALVTETIQNFFLQIKKMDNLNYTKGFLNSIGSNLFYVIGTWFLGISIIGIPVVIFLLFIKGFIFGFSSASIISIYGFKGIFGAFTYLFPHYILLLVISVLLTFYSISFSIKLFFMLFLKKEINLKEAMHKYIKILVLSILGVFLVSIFEIFISPFLIQLFTKFI